LSQPSFDTTHAFSVRVGSPTYWSHARLVKAASALWGRLATLRADIARELRKYDDERFGLIATNVADSAELSIADLIGDVYLAEIERDVCELRDVEDALRRIADGSYGICVECTQPIDPMRLELNPHASRCLQCQKSAESTQEPGQRPARL